jgi:hypothetical protein
MTWHDICRQVEVYGRHFRPAKPLARFADPWPHGTAWGVGSAVEDKPRHRIKRPQTIVGSLRSDFDDNGCCPKKKLCFGEALLSGYTEPTIQVAHPVPILPCHVHTVDTDGAMPAPDIFFSVGFSMYIARC